MPLSDPTRYGYHPELTRETLRRVDDLNPFEGSMDHLEANTSMRAAQEEPETITSQAPIRRTTNPNVRTTKTGKIQHKSKKVGVGRKLTAYDRFLQQRSKYLSKHRSELTPQERMKIIAEEWAVSEKNQHKSRRKNRFLGPDGELHLPLTSHLTATATGDNPTSSVVVFDEDHSLQDGSNDPEDTMQDSV
ncbi:hypothetical protein BGZ65_004122 [Modicella reniformis]|uniref:Uncharacterized protein n=1 Tax=Modicella reniformis TaxID=1440133 RepID=A0A9P6M2Y6_9FUNG|nr:hypothetical protein BGZ65_004122 [Modicella reniformis]